MRPSSTFNSILDKLKYSNSFLTKTETNMIKPSSNMAQNRRITLLDLGSKLLFALLWDLSLGLK